MEPRSASLWFAGCLARRVAVCISLAGFPPAPAARNVCNLIAGH